MTDNVVYGHTGQNKFKVSSTFKTLWFQVVRTNRSFCSPHQYSFLGCAPLPSLQKSRYWDEKWRKKYCAFPRQWNTAFDVVLTISISETVQKRGKIKTVSSANILRIRATRHSMWLSFCWTWLRANTMPQIMLLGLPVTKHALAFTSRNAQKRTLQADWINVVFALALFL